ncbi:MAG: hypothetical protein FWC41_03190 [Firmicutes bacterium]|nr:hypothetical protein [Bacillota bacterium]
MEIFEKFYIKCKSAVSKLGKKTGDLVDVSKLKIKIVEHKDKIDKKLCMMGKMVYSSKTENKTIDEHLLEILVNDIQNLYKEICSYECKIDKIQNKVVCCSCDFRNDSSSVYCSKCGSELHNSNVCGCEDTFDKEDKG